MRFTAFLAYVTIVTLMPPLVVLWNMGALTPFWFLAGDSYLYLGVGVSSDGLMMSFDGERATNGFHPLWQLYVRIVAALVDNPLVLINIVSWSSILLTWVGAILLGTAIKRITDAWMLAILVVPGAYYLLVGQSMQNLGIWAFFDGMEAGLTMALFGLIVLVITRIDLRRFSARFWIVLGLLYATLVLTRLDEVFVPIATAFVLAFWPDLDRRYRRKAAAAILLPTLAALSVYLLWSTATTGVPTPVSGMAKGEGALVSNAWVMLVTLFSPLLDLRALLFDYDPPRAALLGGAFRVMELLIPTVFSALLLNWVLRRERRSPWGPLMAGVAIGVLIKAGYNFTAVHFWHQAAWYYVVSSATMSLAVAMMLAPVVPRIENAGRLLRPALVIGMMVLGSFHASYYTNTVLTDSTRTAQRDFWLNRASIEAELVAREPGIKMLEFGDGILNFSFEFPVRHGFVFVGDQLSLEALRSGRLLRASYADGYRVLSSFEYLHAPAEAATWDSDQIRAFLQASAIDIRVRDELVHFDFEMLYLAQDYGTPFIRLIPRPES
ncbi:MAG: hypothetical protein R3D60_09630 [Paracoccaceae bacterium]